MDGGVDVLWVNYRGGPLAERWLSFRKPRPGDRVPDLSCMRLDGAATRLYAELCGRWALLARCPDPSLVETALGHLGEGVVVLRSNEGSEASLVRPNGHLAWRGRQPAKLDHWLRRALETGSVR